MPTDADRPESFGADHRAAATAFAERVRGQFDAEVVVQYLFGSVAAGTEHPASDVDVLVVVADDADYGAVDDRLLDIAYDVRLRHGVPVEVHTLRESEFEARRQRREPFVGSVLQEGERV